MPKARGRIVNFRGTDEELKQLKIAYVRHGDRSMSAFARKVILNAPSPAGGNVMDELDALDRRLSILEVVLNHSKT